MPALSIRHGARLLCSWDIDSRRLAVGERTQERNGVPILEETSSVAFVLSPDEDGWEHRITIGDIPLEDLVRYPEDAQGSVHGADRYWREFSYFESARGSTTIVLESRRTVSDDDWRQLLSAQVYVMPSKLGEKRFEKMAEDLETLSRSLLVDLYGKSRETHDLRFARAGSSYLSPEQELASIEAVLDELGPLLEAIGRRPASRISSTSGIERYWGEGHLTAATCNWLSVHGIRPDAGNMPLLVRTSRRQEDFDVPEHRTLSAFLQILGSRASRCAEIAHAHVQSIEADKPMRNVRMFDGPTLFESLDRPRIARLKLAVRRAENSAAAAHGLADLYFLRDVKPELLTASGGAFQRSGEYRVAFGVVRRFLLKHAVWFEGQHLSAVTKLTSRLFEQWCLLQIVEAFRGAGLDLREWDATLREYLRSMFIIDFNRGLTFEGQLTPELRIRIRYEPWIRSEATARIEGETLCRGDASSVAWCPDIVVECLRQEGVTWQPVYAVVLDSKYTAKLGDHEWAKTQKYLQIRRTSDMAQVVRQLWLIAPSKPGERPALVSEDPGVKFTEHGASCAPNEAVHFRLMVSPGEQAENSATVVSEPFKQFAQGTLQYLRKMFSRP